MPRIIDRDARREEIAEAVWAVIVDQGIAAVSIRTVAARAGLAVGSVRHVFPTRDELVEFAAELMIRRTTERLLALDAPQDPLEYSLALCRALLPLEADSRAEFEVNLALIAEAPAVPRLEAIRDDAYRGLGDLCRNLLSHALGLEPAEVPDLRVRRLHALIDGLGLHLLTESGAADPDWAMDLLRAELGGRG